MTTLILTPNLLLIRKLESVFILKDEEKKAINDLPISTLSLTADQDIVRVGDQPSRCFLIVEGFTCAYKLTGDGKRQILALYVPGDIPDLQSLHLTSLDISLASISPCRLGFIKHEDMHRLCKTYPRLASAFWRETLVQASITREWLLNIGQRDSYTRIAHLFCELLLRLKVVGLADNQKFKMPITQVELADATGITVVHMNRTLQALRTDGLVINSKTHISVPDWQKLIEAGEFDPFYLHLLKEPAS
ncbi:Crp/Fnr family transcriptional regulator [Vreelandella sp. F11]|uniref:Crp/Fnr family transcriptional regulator n=1 Tax=Vreelandella sp. F11 TaxID=3394751 RepID=UPI0036DAE764